METQSRTAGTLTLALILAGLAGCRTPQPEPTPRRSWTMNSRPDPVAPPATLPRPVVPARPEGEWRTFGESVDGRPLRLFELPGSGPTTLIFAGIHGSEPEGTELADRLIALITDLPEIVDGGHVVIIPAANPDGLAHGRRTNAHGVDLNRNFPAANWVSNIMNPEYHPGPSPASEPESRALIELVGTLQPDAVVSIHSISRGRECNNYDGPAERLARAMAAGNGYPVRPSIGYPTPGSFGNWAGVDIGIPTVTLELPRGGNPDTLWAQNRDALLAVVRNGQTAAIGR